jgi:hypothetical protein
MLPVDAHIERQLDANGVPGAAVAIVDERGAVQLDAPVTRRCASRGRSRGGRP